jgi:hypothetical protein
MIDPSKRGKFASGEDTIPAIGFIGRIMDSMGIMVVPPPLSMVNQSKRVALKGIRGPRC